MLGRVTQGTITSQLLRNINKNLSQMQGLQEQLSTGMKINRPSDDPVGITYSLRYRSDLSLNEQYQTNVNSAASWLDFNDTLLTQVGDIGKRIKELAVKGANGTNPQVALDNIASEMKQLKEQLVDIANSQFKGKYVFNGQFTDKIPYDNATSPTDVVTDTGNLNYAINTGIELTVNLTGNNVFGFPPPGVTAPQNEDDNLFYVIDQMVANLESGNYEGVNGQITALDSRLDKILTQQAEVGARVNRVELMEQRLKDLNVNLETLQSKTEDADIEDLIIRSKVNESIYQASLSVGAKVISPSLVDFLR
ncbi:flagellar biosynthesis protein FlgL [Cohnella sp. CIP 111063]|uniref:flagellar hook-associated protein FlgL n=1 Tax=unclassified Cohnella TaxID=2636738 RepID=UPI000B8BB49C|nr:MULTISPECIES: flagellar hook-associated protein FlgL [unclassified Cohnella]OXS55898.1 flagellar biosynthesis protein FlgL [Cohnella sp. CIP 111063]PRX67100.1 flagellar hook-associated protein 3 FlgL [Cohnella sp. SGD-V74]